jgi:hypothetical protein
MAKFKVGDRVRHVIAGEVPLGSEGTVVGSGMQSMGFRYNVEFDRVPCPYPPGIYWYSAPEWLAPLTPPAEDAWAADQGEEMDEARSDRAAHEADSDLQRFSRCRAGPNPALALTWNQRPPLLYRPCCASSSAFSAAMPSGHGWAAQTLACSLAASCSSSAHEPAPSTRLFIPTGRA